MFEDVVGNLAAIKCWLNIKVTPDLVVVGDMVQSGTVELVKSEWT